MKTKIQPTPSIPQLACSVISALALLSIAAPGAFAQASYRITDLGTLGGTLSVARGINNNGQVVGDSYTNADDILSDRAFLYSGGVMTDLGSLGGTAWANGINDRGQVVGWSNTTNYDYNCAVLWSADARPIDLGTLGGSQSQANGINNNGQIVGYATTSNGSNGVEHAFLYSAGAMSDLNSQAGTNPAWVLQNAYAINDNGEIVGAAYSNIFAQAFLYSGGVITYLGYLPGGSNHSAALGLNTNGQVVGWSAIPGQSALYYHAFLYSGGVMTDLGDLGGAAFSMAMGVNNHGQVVGWSQTTTNILVAFQHAFLYSGGKMTDLNSPIATNSGWLLKVATAINDNGQIVGWGVNPSGQTHAFLLTPLPSLGITCSGHNIILSWPTNATGFALVENSDLVTTNWGAVMIAPLLTNGQYQVVLPILPDSSRFYRLQSP